MQKENVIFVALIILLGIFLGLLLSSFSDVHYYEYGFKKQLSTGKVDTSEVYTSGRHWVGPDYGFKKFRADAHFVELPSISVFTSDKLEVTISCAFQYFLRKHDLAELHREYDLFYKPVIQSTGQAMVKSQAASIPITEYLKDREKVEQKIFKALAERLGGICCAKDCAASSSCKKGCKAYSTCTREDRGLFVDVLYFQLHEVDIADDIKTRYLRQIIETAEEEKALYTQGQKLVEKETDRLKNAILNEAKEITQNATAQSAVIAATANAQALVKVEQARNSGLSLIYQRLNITTEQHKASFAYLRALRNHEGAQFNVNYNTLMARGN